MTDEEITTRHRRTGHRVRQQREADCASQDAATRLQGRAHRIWAMRWISPSKWSFWTVPRSSPTPSTLTPSPLTAVAYGMP